MVVWGEYLLPRISSSFPRWCLRGYFLVYQHFFWILFHHIHLDTTLMSDSISWEFWDTGRPVGFVAVTCIATWRTFLHQYQHLQRRQLLPLLFEWTYGTDNWSIDDIHRTENDVSPVCWMISDIRGAKAAFASSTLPALTRTSMSSAIKFEKLSVRATKSVSHVREATYTLFPSCLIWIWPSCVAFSARLPAFAIPFYEFIDSNIDISPVSSRAFTFCDRDTSSVSGSLMSSSVIAVISVRIKN